ncbi:MAG TPA: DMT family transporter [Burkholderiales bacterium]|nr:DMT family transporter [Burkholderiales bacterium]
MSHARGSLIAAIVTMVLWGVNFAFVKYLLDALGIGPFLFIRFVSMPLLAFLLLFLVFRRDIAKTWPKRPDLPRFVACGIIGHALHVGIVFWGISLSTAFSSALVLTSGPLFTLAILVLLGAERLRVSQVAGTVLAMAGIAVFLSDKFARGVTHAGLGDLVVLVAAAFFSLYTVLVRPLVERYGPLIVLAYTLLFGAPPMVLLTIPSIVAADLGRLTPMMWFGLFWAIVLSSVGGWLVWAWVNHVRGIARSAPLMYLPPPIAGIVAWLTLGEQFTWLKIAGAGITLAGIAWAQFGGGRPPPREAAQPDSG